MMSDHFVSTDPCSVRYAIYRKPPSHPNHWVVREVLVWRDGTVEVTGEPLAVARTLEEARRAIPPYLSVNEGLGADVYETWM